MSEYKKFCYWVDSHGLRNVRRSLEGKEIELRDETRIPCRVLRESMNTTFIAPPAWDGFCKRRTSWFRKSEMAHKFLIVSNSLLDVRDLDDPIIIMDSNFRPNRFPSSEEISQLIESQEFQKRKPSEWDKPDPLEKDFYQRWFKRQQGKEPFDFGQILLSHSANHANFLAPKFYVIVNEAIAPYSIADSIHVCSSCLEFFNILGSQWPTKYVVPCIGAAQFAHLSKDQYFEVRIYKNKDPGRNNVRPASDLGHWLRR
jgi:hypothetical protein